MAETRVLAGRLITGEELWRMPDDGKRWEIIRGRLVEMPPAGGEHGYVVSNVSALIRQVARQLRLGAVVAGDPGVVLERGPDTVRAPDVAFYTAARWDKVVDKTHFLDFPPDLAVEVVSPHDRPREAHEKALMWRSFGVAMVWVVEPKRRTVRVYRADGSDVTVGDDGELDGGTVLPGLRLDVRECFD